MKNKLKHTPGPWRCNENVYVMNSVGETICILYSPKTEEDLKNAKNNARLIAAAPEMLEALKDNVRNFIDRLKSLYNVKFDFNNDTKTRDMKIIEKATGMKIEDTI